MEIRVQRGVQVFSGLSSVATLSPSVNTSRAFPFLGNIARLSGGPNAGTFSDKAYRDSSGAPKITSASQLTFTRPSGAEAIDYRFNWEVWEYVGAGGGPHEFIIRAHADAFLGAFDTIVDVAVPSISDIGDVVPVICGVQSTDTGILPTSNIVQVQRLGTNQIRFRRLTSGLGRELLITYSVVEFLGSAWKIQEVLHAFSAAGTDESESITPVNAWTRACLFSSNVARADLGRNVGPTVRPGANTSTVRFRLASGATAVGSTVYAYVLENSQISVQHLDSITGGRPAHSSGAFPPVDFDESISALPDLAQAGSIVSHDTATTGNNPPRSQWGWRLTAANNLRVENTRSSPVGDWAAQAIDFSQMLPTIGVEANPLPVVATAAIPAPAAVPGPVSANLVPVAAGGLVQEPAGEPGPVAVNPVAVAASGVVPAPKAAAGVVANLAITSASAVVPAPSAVPGAVTANPAAVAATGAVPAPSASGALSASPLPVVAAAQVPVPAAVPGEAVARPTPVRSLALVPIVSIGEPEGLVLEVDSLLRVQENVDSPSAIQADVEALAAEQDSVDSFQSIDLEVETPSALSSDVTALGEQSG